jgi:Polyketide cyclase / dehydrase and lipid transport
MSEQSRAPYRMTGTLEVELPPEEAFRLFTARGERDWVDGWDPRFPADTPDDTAPGTVFETDVHGERTTWVVAERDAGRRISYARVTPDSRAGTVTVELRPSERGSLVTVTYVLTALSDDARPELESFAAGYPEFLRGWQEAIAARASG